MKQITKQLTPSNFSGRFFLLAIIGLIFSTNMFAAPPANDMWEFAASIGGTTGTLTGTIDEATVQPCEPVHFYEDNNSPTPPNKSVWYRWTAPANGSYTFKVNSPTVESRIAAYVFAPGICNGSPGVLPLLVRENRFYNLNYGAVNVSQVTFAVNTSQTIYISVENDFGFGEFNLSWSKNRYKYHAQFDTANSATDLAVVRNISPDNSQWWFARSKTPFVTYPFNNALSYGIPADKKLMGDFNGDGVTDMAAIRKENGHLTWWISKSNGSNIKVQQFGLDTDKPIVGDYDGDGIADIAVTRAESNGLKTWHILRSSDGQYQTFQFGLKFDRQTVGDYDGDGKTDVVAIREGTVPPNKFTWYIRRSSDNALMIREFGQFGDYPQVVDFDNDGKTDIAVFRSGYAGSNPNEAGIWFSLDSSSTLPLEQVPTRYQSFGQQFDFPQAGDYDADGKTDLAINRNGTWWIRESRNGSVFAFNFGISSDLPMADTGIAGAFYAF